MSLEASSASSSSDFTRLHISPLDPDLLKIVLPASVASQARNVSYHTVETFPERRYGFVELPAMEAEKIKKKLNGAVLKGAKLRIEKARPEERVEPTGELDKEDEKKKSKKRSRDSADGSRKRKRDRDAVVDGFALTDRKVKRGWTEPADQRRKKSKKDKEKEKDGKHTEKKKRQRSKYTEQEECLLKTKVPPNAVANMSAEDGQPRKRNKKGRSREVTVHEFEKTTKFPSFLRNSAPEDGPRTAVEYLEGKGWVDEDGNVVETVKTKKPAKSTPNKAKKATPPPVEDSDDDSTSSSSGTSSSGSSSDEDEEEVQEPKAAPQKDQDSSSRDSSSDDDDDDDESPQQPEHATPLSAIKADASRPMSSSSSRSLTIKIPPPITPSATKVHPLEALYKRSKPDDNTAETPAEEPQPFSFFGGGGDDDDDDDIEEEPPVERTPAPMTPFTRQDIEWRNVRSAAPTPDTAHPSRMRNFWADEQDDDADVADAIREAEQGQHDEDEDDGDQEEQGTATAAPPAPGSSDFQAWFWDNRRDLNQSWMKRRKTAAKERRHRENKARASKAV